MLLNNKLQNLQCCTTNIHFQSRVCGLGMNWLVMGSNLLRVSLIPGLTLKNSNHLGNILLMVEYRSERVLAESCDVS